MEEHLGSEHYEDEDLADESQDTARFRELFGRDMWRRTAFACIFFTCLVAPYFAIFTFAPQVFDAVGLTDPKASIIGSNTVAFLGALVGMFVIERVDRRPLLLTSFYVMVVTLGVIGAWGSAPSVVLIVCFRVVRVPSTPSPGTSPGSTRRRSSPPSCPSASTRSASVRCVLVGAAICAAGLLVTHLWAPETTSLSLTDSKEAAPPGAKT